MGKWHGPNVGEGCQVCRATSQALWYGRFVLEFAEWESERFEPRCIAQELFVAKDWNRQRIHHTTLRWRGKLLIAFVACLGRKVAEQTMLSHVFCPVSQVRYTAEGFNDKNM